MQKEQKEKEKQIKIGYKSKDMTKRKQAEDPRHNQW